MALQSGSTIYTNDVSSYLNVSKYDIIQYSDYNQAIETIDRQNQTINGLNTEINNLNQTIDRQNQTISDLNQTIEILNRKPIGGKIFYDAGNNGATYTFYDSSGNVITDTSISGLQNAVIYKIEGTPTKDRFYVMYPDLLDSGNHLYWGFYRNADIKSSGGNIVNTGTAIGTGKTATRAILNYINTYASNETASTSSPSSDISQASPNGYNLYKNCGTSSKYLWDIIRDANNKSLGGYNDWFIPSKDEMSQIVNSGVISNITSSTHLWLSSAYSTSNYAWHWYYDYKRMDMNGRLASSHCVVCRAF